VKSYEGLVNRNHGSRRIVYHLLQGPEDLAEMSLAFEVGEAVEPEPLDLRAR